MIGWSDDYYRLIFPVRNEKDQVVFWQGRYFGQAKDEPKYYTRGSKRDIFDFVHDTKTTSTLVCVEDKVSAIRVGKAGYTSLPLYGSDLSLERARKLSDRFWTLVLWLDPDMKASALKQALKLSDLFRNVKCIYSDKDPKEYTESEIKEKVK